MVGALESRSRFGPQGEKWVGISASASKPGGWGQVPGEGTAGRTGQDRTEPAARVGLPQDPVCWDTSRALVSGTPSVALRGPRPPLWASFKLPGAPVTLGSIRTPEAHPATSVDPMTQISFLETSNTAGSSFSLLKQ